MFGRLTRGVSDSSSSSDSESGESAAGGVSGSSLGAVDQDRNGKGKSGDDGAPDRVSLQAPSCLGSGYVVLGARPKKKSVKKEEGETDGRKKGVEWTKKDRKAARCYRGKGQKMAAARDAKLAAEAGCGGKSKEEGDALGLIIAARALKKGPRSKHGPGTDQSSRKRTGTGRDASAYGLIVAPLVFTLLSAVSLYYLSATESTNLMIGSVRGIEKSQLARLGAGAFGILLVLFAVLLGTPAGRNRGRR